MKDNLFIQILTSCRRTKTAAAAVNILNHLTARAVVRAAENAGRPLILQPSTATVRRFGIQAFAQMVAPFRTNSSVPVALHLDHCRDAQLAMDCAEAGWDSVMVDYSAFPYEENARKTREIALFAHERGVAVEGEIGRIAGVEDDVANDMEQFSSLEDTLRFLGDTGIDAIAPAIGTMHGLYTAQPKLNFELVRRLNCEGALVVAHGGTGLPAADFHRLIACGAVKCNISTALKHAYLDTARETLTHESVTPLDFDQAVENACAQRLEGYIRLFAGQEAALDEAR